MANRRGRDIYEATEKDYDTSGYRRKMCSQWVANQHTKPADDFSPTMLEPGEHQKQYQQTYKQQSQKYCDMNEAPKGSQRHELSQRVRSSNNSRNERNNKNGDDFMEPFADFVKSPDKPFNAFDTSEDKSHRPSQTRTTDKRRPDKQSKLYKKFNLDDVFRDDAFDFEIDGLDPLLPQSSGNTRQRAKSDDFLRPITNESGKHQKQHTETHTKRQSQKYSNVNEASKGSQRHQSSQRARLINSTTRSKNNNNNGDEFVEPFAEFDKSPEKPHHHSETRSTDRRRREKRLKISEEFDYGEFNNLLLQSSTII